MELLQIAQKVKNKRSNQNWKYTLYAAIAAVISGVTPLFECLLQDVTVTIDGAEWVYNAGEMNKLERVPKSAWSMIEKFTRKKK